MSIAGSQSRFEWLSLARWLGSEVALSFLLLLTTSSIALANSNLSQERHISLQVKLMGDEGSSPNQTPPVSLAFSVEKPVVSSSPVENLEESQVIEVGMAEPALLAQTQDSAESQEFPEDAVPLRPDPAFTAPLPPPQSIPDAGIRDLINQDSQVLDFDDYRLGPGDSIFVNVRQFPDLSFQGTLDIQGNLIVPLQGVTPLRGLSLEEAENLITQIYNQFVINPDVSITLVAQRGVQVTILGEVVRPGFYPLGAPQISAALLSAGGTTGQADLRSILIQRRLPDGQLLERTVDLFTPLKEGEALPNVALQDGDTIMVARLDPAALDEYDQEIVSRSTIAQPTITVRLLSRAGGRGGATSGNLSAIELPNGSRFADALVSANLSPTTSKLKEIALIRFDEEAGRAVTTNLDGNDAFRGIPSENPPLQNNDVIIVDRTFLARVTFAFSTLTQPFRDVLGFLLFFESIANSAEDLFGP